MQVPSNFSGSFRIRPKELEIHHPWICAPQSVLLWVSRLRTLTLSESPWLKILQWIVAPRLCGQFLNAFIQLVNACNQNIDVFGEGPTQFVECLGHTVFKNVLQFVPLGQLPWTKYRWPCCSLDWWPPITCLQLQIVFCGLP